MKKLLFLIAIGLLSGSLVARAYKAHDKKHKHGKKAKAKKRKPVTTQEAFAVEKFKYMPQSQAGFKEVVGGIFG